MFFSVIVVQQTMAIVAMHEHNRQRKEQGLPPVTYLPMPAPPKEPERPSCGLWVALAFIFGMTL